MNHLINALLTFALIYDINPKILPGVTSARIAIVFLILFNLNVLRDLYRLYKSFFLVILLLLMFAFVQSLFSKDYTQFSRLFFFTIYCLLGSCLLAQRYANLSAFLFSVLILVSVQSVVLIYTFWMPDFRLTLDSFIIYGGNVGLECLYRTFGLSSSSGAHLSITQSFGFAAGLLLLHKKNRSIIIIPLCILCISSTVFVGRTGLLLSVFFFIVYFLFSLKKKSKVVLSLLALLLIAAVNVKWVDLFAGQLNKIDNFSSDYFVEWLSEGFEISNNKTVNALLQEQEVPELTIKNFFIGTGTVTTEDGKNTSGHDSGYIQTYYSLGLLPAFIFYISFILFVYKSFKKYDTEIIYLINFVILALEIKEPVLFKYSEGIILLTFLWIIKNTYSNSKNICVVST